MVVNFGCALGFSECCAFSAGLSKLRFEKSPPRESAMTVEHAKAFIATALKCGDLRGLSMAIGVATQFETMLRQKDVIGEWLPDEGTGREAWTGSYTWENIPGGIFRLRPPRPARRSPTT